MAWSDYFVAQLPNAKVVVSPEGRPFVSMEILPREYVEIHLTLTESELPFKINYRSFDSVGDLLEERHYASAGTKDLARQAAMDICGFRLNSQEFVLDGE
jgi:hypothetical protein